MSNPHGNNKHGIKICMFTEISCLQVIYFLCISDPPDDELWAMFEQFSQEKNNQNCSCDEGCQSHVAQQPRKCPIEVFRMAKCGWGVFLTVNLPKGSVLGVYTRYVMFGHYLRWKTNRYWVCDGICLFFILNNHCQPCTELMCVIPWISTLMLYYRLCNRQHVRDHKHLQVE